MRENSDKNSTCTVHVHAVSTIIVSVVIID